MNHLEHSWNRAWASLGLRPSDGLFDNLIQAYSEPHRHYHTGQHLEECIAHLEAAHELAHQLGEVEIALWFHDSIYEPQAKNNELRSAEWAVASLRQANASTTVQERVRDLVMATCHEAVPNEPDHQLLVDIDLAILGSLPTRFAEYDQQVKSEYSWVPNLLYSMKRKEILKGFLARQNIYSTSYFRQRYESQARENLRMAVA
ncbi:MAG: N-methyl-D-aspartate receptor NMDAR2C subunit [Burkholderiaceae bacterium]|jgi:predicted metal-dependent HD superfamily phosphohydrolase|nr:N-methyl-D-aspartate receptor NMDAR2C subunit [Burkholderiaceae bacterium]